MAARGTLVVFEGIDGSGLSTHAGLLSRHLQLTERRKVILTKEPSDGPMGVQLRMALRGRLRLEPAVMALGFAADRLDHLATDIEPRLQTGQIVITDRYYLSSLAYQALHCDLSWLRTINALCRPPDLTIFLDVPVKVCMHRLIAQRAELELFESADQLEKVRQNYLSLIQEGTDVAVVPGVSEGKERPIEAVAGEIQAAWTRSQSKARDLTTEGSKASGGHSRS